MLAGDCGEWLAFGFAEFVGKRGIQQVGNEMVLASGAVADFHQANLGGGLQVLRGIGGIGQDCDGS